MRIVHGMLAALAIAATIGLAGCIEGMSDMNPPTGQKVSNGAGPSLGFASTVVPKFSAPDNLGADAEEDPGPP